MVDDMSSAFEVLYRSESLVWMNQVFKNKLWNANFGSDKTTSCDS